MLAVQDIYFHYHAEYTAVPAIEKVSFSIPGGQIVGLFGDNGAGKTTLMRCIAGFLKPQRGEITLDGESGEGIRKKLAFVSGTGASFSSMTPMETGAFLNEFYEQFDMERYKKLIAFFELPEQPIKSMSTGQRSRAELAAGFSKGAQYLILDEPFTGKDVFTRQDFIKIMAGGLHESGSILLSTHLVQEVEPVIDRAIILHKGLLVRDVFMDELRENGETLIGALKQAEGYDEKKAARLFEQEKPAGKNAP
ncbi:ABC transporter ATP-binding protein [Christensenellaceae bacterium OttesenSCG-928-M15]|nr:ABC transporter ATP-binding protein [Christensenellaceae bacterium OttesenSCG-928-M15]